MKYAGLFIAFFMGLALVNGNAQANGVGPTIGVGPVAYEDFDELRRSVMIIQDITEDIRNNMDVQGEKISEILGWIAEQAEEKSEQQEIAVVPEETIPEETTPEQITRPGIRIIDDGRLYQDAIVNFIQYYSRLPRSEIESIVSIYILEAKKERVNHDIAIAQMCYATQFLNNRTLLINRNYSGLSDAIFTDKTIGIRAHIQHLKGYATRDDRFSEAIVDPRFYMAGFVCLRGTITVFDDLFFSAWSPGNALNYGRNVKSILDSLYQYSNIGSN
jgi:hypothetical protein